MFAGAASPNEHSASLVLLRMAEITLIEACTSEQVVSEVERNLEDKMPGALPAFRLLVSRCLRVVPNPPGREIAAVKNTSVPKDLPILVSTRREGCSYLAMYNLKHYQPGLAEVVVLKPGDLVLRIRYLLSQLRCGSG